MEKSKDYQLRQGKYETTVIFFFSKIPWKTQTPQEKMLCPELGVVSIELFTNFQYTFCLNAAHYRKRHFSDVCCPFGLSKSQKPGKCCLRFDLQCTLPVALPLVLLISRLGYFVADDT